MKSDEILKQVAFRSMDDHDEPFIYSSWLRSFFDNSDFTKNISNSNFFYNHHRVIGRILARTSVFAIVAHAIDSPNIILAYLVYEYIEDKIILHYVYVKEAFRREGIAKEMLKTVTTDFKKIMVSHLTNSFGPEYIRRKYDLIYNPYAM